MKAILRKRIIEKNKTGLKNKSFSLISSNCIGGFIMHELGIKFRTPTINLFFYAEDYLNFLENLEHNLVAEITQLKRYEYSYPVGLIDNRIPVYFMHYKTFDEAMIKWKERSKRVDFSNLFIMMTDRDGCTEEYIKRFDNLPYHNKVIFTNKPYPKYSSAYYIKGFEKQQSVGHLFQYKKNLSGVFGKKYYDDFDYINFFNKTSNI